MADPVESAPIPTYVNDAAAPVVAFDYAAAHGVMSGAVQVELAGRTLVPMPDGSVRVEIITAGRLRCSPAAAKALRDALDSCLRMIEEPAPAPVVGRMN